jgi:hypothetical protein
MYFFSTQVEIYDVAFPTSRGKATFFKSEYNATILRFNTPPSGPGTNEIAIVSLVGTKRNATLPFANELNNEIKIKNIYPSTGLFSSQFRVHVEIKV